MLTREDVIKKVKLFANEVIKNGVPLDKVILFGSYAREQQNDHSDIDVALVSKTFSGFGYEDRKQFSRINIQKEFVEIETKTYPTDYFDRGDPFIDEIKLTGIELYSSKNKAPSPHL